MIHSPWGRGECGVEGTGLLWDHPIPRSSYITLKVLCKMKMHLFKNSNIIKNLKTVTAEAKCRALCNYTGHMPMKPALFVTFSASPTHAIWLYYCSCLIDADSSVLG